MAERKIDPNRILDGGVEVPFELLANGKVEVTTTAGDKIINTLNALPSPRFSVDRVYSKQYCLNDDGQVSEEGRRYIERRTR